jgi:hypothetical protein
MLMPFLDRIAVRALFLFGTVSCASFIGAIAVIAIRLFTDNAIPGWATFTLLGALLLSLTALGTFLVLFATFSQSRAVSLQVLETDISRAQGFSAPTPSQALSRPYRPGSKNA